MIKIDSVFASRTSALIAAAREDAANAAVQAARGSAAIEFALRLTKTVLANPSGKTGSINVGEVAAGGKLYQIAPSGEDPAAAVHLNAGNWIVQTVDKESNKIQLQSDKDTNTWACVWHGANTGKVPAQMQRVGPATQVVLCSGARVQMQELAPGADDTTPESVVVRSETDPQVAFLKSGTAAIRYTSGPWEMVQMDKSGKMIAKSRDGGTIAVAQVDVSKGTVQDAVINGVLAVEDHGAIATSHGDGGNNDSLTLAEAKAMLLVMKDTKKKSVQDLKDAAEATNVAVKHYDSARQAQQTAENLRAQALELTTYKGTEVDNPFGDKGTKVGENTTMVELDGGRVFVEGDGKGGIEVRAVEMVMEMKVSGEGVGGKFLWDKSGECMWAGSSIV